MLVYEGIKTYTIATDQSLYMYNKNWKSYFSFIVLQTAVYIANYVKFRFSKKVINFETIPLKRVKFTKGAGAGAKCDHFKLGVHTRVRAHLNLDVRGACVRPKKRSQLTPC